MSDYISQIQTKDGTLYDIKDTSVADWAREENKPSYTADEIGALSADTSIPTVTDTYSSTSSDAMSGKAVASAISDLIGSAPETLDTLEEIADELNKDKDGSVVNSIMSAIGNLKTSFQAGVDSIYNKIVSAGTTPSSKSLDDVVAGIGTLSTNRYNAGVTATQKGNATTGDVLASKTFTSTNGVNITGTIPSKAAATYYPSTTDQTISSGNYLSGTQTIKAVTTSNITAANIKNGTVVKVGDSSDASRIKTVTGTYTSDATATADKIFSGYTAYVKGTKITGTASSLPSASYPSNAPLYFISVCMPPMISSGTAAADIPPAYVTVYDVANQKYLYKNTETSNNATYTLSSDVSVRYSNNSYGNYFFVNYSDTNNTIVYTGSPTLSSSMSVSSTFIRFSTPLTTMTDANKMYSAVVCKK